MTLLFELLKQRGFWTTSWPNFGLIFCQTIDYDLVFSLSKLKFLKTFKFEITGLSTHNATF